MIIECTRATICCYELWMRRFTLLCLLSLVGCCATYDPLAEHRAEMEAPISDDFGGEPVTREALLGTWRTDVEVGGNSYWMAYTLQDNGKYLAQSDIMDAGVALEAKWSLKRHDGSGRTEIRTLDHSDPFGKEVRMIDEDTLLVLHHDGTTAEFQRVPE